MHLAQFKFISIALDMVGVMGLMTAWLVGVWGSSGLLVAALVKMEPGLTIGAAATAITAVLFWWISSGIVRRKRFRIGLAGLASLGLAASLFAALYLADSIPGDKGTSALQMSAWLVFYAALGAILLVGAIAKPGD
jgi:hypothetical protein